MSHPIRTQQKQAVKKLEFISTEAVPRIKPASLTPIFNYPRISSGLEAMHLLDWDLDVFLDRVAYRHPYGWRQDDEEEDTSLIPWTGSDFRLFLEVACGLSIDRRIPGRALRHHDEGFHCWRELIRRGVLEVPFRLTHIDAHSDLGMGGAITGLHTSRFG